MNKPQARKVRDQLTGKPFRPLVDILQDVDDHYRDNPTHGMGCACVDQYVAEVRRQLMAMDCGSTEAGARNYKTGFDWFSTMATMIMRSNNHRYDGPRD